MMIEKFYDSLTNGKTPPIVNIAVMNLMLLVGIFFMLQEHIEEEKLILKEVGLSFTHYKEMHAASIEKHRDGQKLRDKDQDSRYRELRDLVHRIDKEGSRKWRPLSQ